MRERAAYGTWESPFSLEELFSRPSSPMYPQWHGGHVYWLESRAREGGRFVLVRQEDDGSETTITPEGFNVRTRVHEYGGRCFVLSGEHVIFSHFTDQRLYRQRLDPFAVPEPLTPSRNADGSVGRYADLEASADGTLLVFVYECQRGDGPPSNSIGAMRLDPRNGALPLREPTELVTGHDFFANPVISPDAQWLAWVQWDHPSMPWDSSAVLCGAVRVGTERIVLEDVTVVVGGDGHGVCQLLFDGDGSLYFAMDRQGVPESDPGNFWNIHRFRDGGVRRVTADLAEYGEPHWVFGHRRLTGIGRGELLAVRTGARGDELVRVDVASGAARALAGDFLEFSQLSPASRAVENDAASGRRVLMIAADAHNEPALLDVDVDGGGVRVLKRPPAVMKAVDVSAAQPLRYTTGDGVSAHAYFYAPRNSRFEPLPATRPPLLVVIHGGPTARSTPAFNVAKQYWTTLGYAVLDVNYRGSSGHGRAYRQGLLGGWGEVDVDDIVAAVRYVVEQGYVDGERVCVRGTSAGGYAVLRLLTRHPDAFRAGACYYGIGSLITLAELTHKFEAHYIDGLIGEAFDASSAAAPASRYRSRSPIFEMHRIRSALIVFQGKEDKVVPVEVAREVVETLERNAIAHEYVEYAGEGHGFRIAATRADALARETAFYRRVLQLDPVSR